ncbi:ATP-binding cassette domain-containing protein [Galbibacter sp. EGI 63066]|uniref:ATP-binding cassette domain-containing protein n=1 Tax=Galbibacter sp. EGI 63066 TaxID=2993559 RepID=UPI0022491E19|nr:ATP-binding cassette domain-containing protein [Galbibacter sp. EGI 63066]MCX2678459.1 ATP-binding cassette domain-containing protein [Galbibacter sp. EGI 63066]
MTLKTAERQLVLDHIDLLAEGHSILKDIKLKIVNGQAMAITGRSGSGKTSLAKIISEAIKPSSGTLENPFKTVFVSQQDYFSELAGLASTYYSKRYEFHEYEKQMGVGEYLAQVNHKCQYTDLHLEEVPILETFQIKHLLSSNLMQLSNGERKRLQLVQAFFERPEMLIMDQPFTGLDVDSRKLLTKHLQKVSSMGVTLVLICGIGEIPDFIKKAITLEKGEIVYQGTPSTISDVIISEESINSEIDVDALFHKSEDAHETIIKMKDVNVSMKEKPILKAINWEVKSGECWALLGHNGAGKSTLLSLVTADNPQGYTNDLTLFGRKRGSGESIWDIKKKIGFLSPELHLYFMRGKGVLNTVPGMQADIPVYSTISCLDVIISGFNDEVGTISIPSEGQIELAKKWLELVKLSHLEDVLFVHASLGEQRVLLLLRALIKSPALLILDEPSQGMDAQQVDYFKKLLDHICSSRHITMVYVSHRKEEIPDVVTKVLRLENGSVI